MKKRTHSIWFPWILAMIYIAQGALAYGSLGACASHLDLESCCCHHSEVEGSPCCEDSNPDPAASCDCILEPGKPIHSHLPFESSQIKYVPCVALAAFWDIDQKPDPSEHCGKVASRTPPIPPGPRLRVILQQFLI